MKKINFSKITFLIITFIILFNSFIFLIPIHVNGSYNQVTIEANKNNNNGIDSFPESYQIMLKKLVSETGHENWKFKAFYTNIDWSELTSSSNENTCLRNTVHKDNGTMICSCGREGDKGYYCASSKAVNYYLDPRNFLTETTIFQFLDLSSSTKVSIEDIQRAVEGTYLSGEVEGESYAQIIYDAAEESGESALSIVVKIFQELGRGKNLPGMIAGNNEIYPNAYNFFNYGATDGEGNTLRGLEYANKSGWNTPRKALIEGAKLIANSYIGAGQNTKYTFKFDVVDDTATGLYWHQYMTNIQDPNNQAKMLYDEYLNNNWLNNELTFVIPVYKNMPTYVKLPSALTTENGELYFISSNYVAVSLRSEASTSSETVASLKKDTVVLMLQFDVNNSGWSKVSVDGKEGYVSNKYLTKVNTKEDVYQIPEQPSKEDINPPVELPEIKPTVPPTVQPTPPVEPNNDFKIEGNYIITIPKVKLSDIKAKYNVKSAIKDGKNINDNDNLATGSIINIDNKEYIVVKLGDVSCDGEVDARDSARILRYSIGQYEMNEAQRKASDISKDSEIDARDSARILRYSINTYEIEL